MKRLLSNVFTVGAFTALSRVLGLVREMFQSRLIGAGVEQSAFTLAFALPNMARKLCGEGALTAAFVPVFKAEAEAVSLRSAERLARAVITVVTLALGAAVLLATGGVELAVKFSSALGFDDPERTALTASLVKTLLPYMLFICGAAFGMSVLNSLGRFKASSFMPCLLNLVWIGALGALAFFPALSPAERVKFVALAILAGGALQMAFLFWRMRAAGVTALPTLHGWFEPKTRLVWKNLSIAALGAGAIQINYMLDQFLAQLASPWAAGVIGYAERLMDLPLGIVGVAFGTVLLPTLAGFFAKNDLEGARSALSSSVSLMMFVMLPSAAGLFVLAPEVTGVIYQGGDFDAVATVRVSRALAVYAVGLGFFGFAKTMVPWFQAQGDMKTPLWVTTGAVVVNAALNCAAVFLLPVEFRHVGLAASTVFCSAASCAALVVLARRKGRGPLGLAGILPSLAKMLVASAAMGGAVCAVRYFAAPHIAVSSETLSRVLALALYVLTGVVAYAVFSLALMRGEVRSFLRKRRRG